MAKYIDAHEIYYRADEPKEEIWKIKYNAIFRELTNEMPSIAWSARVRIAKCHWGQRKLFWSEFEFLQMAMQKFKTDFTDYTLVYVGAAPNGYIKLIRDYFPKLRMILYDPARFDDHAYNDAMITVKTGKNGFFTDDTVPEVIELCRGRHILFVSDIRMTPTESAIYADMLSQQRWTVRLQADMTMLKFRLPYDVPENMNVDYADVSKISDLDGIITIPDMSAKKPSSFLYLRGHIQLQIYAPVSSTETRLIVYGKARKKSGTTKLTYDMQLYDYKEYESQMNYFNMVSRQSLYKYKSSNLMKEHLLGYDDGYESVSEYFIMYNYLKFMNERNERNEHKSEKQLTRDCIKNLYIIDRFMIEKFGKQLIDCIMPKKFFRNRSGLTKEHIEEYIRSLITRKRLVTTSINIQETELEYHRKNMNGPRAILTNREYSMQLNYIREHRKNVVDSYDGLIREINEMIKGL